MTLICSFCGKVVRCDVKRIPKRGYNAYCAKARKRVRLTRARKTS